MRILRLFFSLTGLLCLFGVGAAYAQTATKPFMLPMLDPPGPSTWLLGQPYGNTIGAFLRGDEWYRAGQRLHFGLDFSMPCGTPLVSIGDGTVMFVDDMGFGSAPHNLLIRHDAGYVSLYGHLLERPTVQPGQRVLAGDVVARSGDPDLTCTSRPHLHFELRSLDYQTTYNPVEYIDANWHMLAGVGSFRYPLFQQDLDNARQWMSLDDQPTIVFGGRALNLYNAPYPDFRAGTPGDNPPLDRPELPLSPEATATLRKLVFDGCCTGAWWSPSDADRLYTIDGGAGQRAAIFYWDVGAEAAFGLEGEAPPPFTSADGTHTITPVNEDEFAIRSLTDGVEYRVNTGGEFPTLSPSSGKILFNVTSEVSTSLTARPTTDIWVADVDGNNARIAASVSGGLGQWLDDSRLLVTAREDLATRISVVNVDTGEAFTLGQWERVRSLSIAPGGGRLMFLLNNQPDPATSGVYTVETTPGAVAQKLDWFGAWRWRDANAVYYTPFMPDAPYNTLHYFNTRTGEDRALTDSSTQPFLIANGDWSVSADGSRIAFWNALDMTTWLIEITS